MQLGRSDASLGILLKQSADKTFSAVDPAVSGLYIDGDVRAITQVKNKIGESIIVVAKNNDAVQVLKVNNK